MLINKKPVVKTIGVAFLGISTYVRSPHFEVGTALVSGWPTTHCPMHIQIDTDNGNFVCSVHAAKRYCIYWTAEYGRVYEERKRGGRYKVVLHAKVTQFHKVSG